MILPDIERLVVGLGERKYLAGYIFTLLHNRGVRDVSEITPLSKSFRARLTREGFFVSSQEIINKLTDPDGTIKYVYVTSDRKQIESVLLFDDDRRTLCVSTQAGCAMGCVFCATGLLGLRRNLTTGEIVGQVNVVTRDLSLVTRETRAESQVTNVVFMGMGEPLANYDAVMNAIRILNHPKGKNIGIRHITISTCGLPEGIERLADEDIRPRLAVSLNAPTDVIRCRLMPVAKKYPLGRLMSAVKLYQKKTRNRVTFEYCLIKDVNDTALHARLLAKRLRGLMCNVNLIEYNQYPGSGLEKSGPKTIERFAAVLTEAGLETTIRRKFGRKIKAACGQLGATENLI